MRRRLVWPVGPLLLSFDCAARTVDTVWPGLSNYLICNDGRFYDDMTPQKRSMVAAFLERSIACRESCSMLCFWQCFRRPIYYLPLL